MKLIPVLASAALAVCVALPAAAQNVPYGYDPNSGYYPNTNYNSNYGYQGNQTYQNNGQSNGLLSGVLGTVVSGLLRQTVVGGNNYAVPNGNYQQNYGNYQQYPQYPQYQQNYNAYQSYPNQGNYNPYGQQNYGNYNPYAAQSGYGNSGLLTSILSAVLSQGLIR
ncbi:MAG: hypothetical protein H7Y37_01650 [Anaerolineae bacterium]|nr:hypothetical protein [Gloeobacterales cyanobacterium ES-bin-313]